MARPDGAAIELREKAALLAQPATYGPDVKVVETVETHMSLVFLAGPTVYKLKKPVVYPFLDFSTLAARERSCRDELRLNRQLAPDVYLGLSAITRDADGTLAVDGGGRWSTGWGGCGGCPRWPTWGGCPSRPAR